MGARRGTVVRRFDDIEKGRDAGLKVLTWNLNHRAARRRIPGWIAEEVVQSAADVAILTEYVTGPDHERFVDELRGGGLPHVLLSDYVARENQILIASRQRFDRGHVVAPRIHSSVPPNVLHVEGPNGMQVLGFRMPAFNWADRELKRATWKWLLTAAQELQGYPAVIAGDFNTAASDGAKDCGDCIQQLVDQGWRHVQPESGFSFRHARSGSERCIDHLFASRMIDAGRAEYSWQFTQHGEEAASGKVGVPDHAMLLVNFAVSKVSLM